MIPRIKQIEIQNDFLLLITFDDGERKLYDVKDDIATIKVFKELREKEGLWEQAKLDTSRTCVYWNDNIDLPSDTLYEYGKDVEEGCSVPEKNVYADKVAEPQAEYQANTKNAESAPVLNAHNKEEFPPAHTAEHLLNQTMGRMFGCERSRNMHIERKKSKINFQLDRPLTADEVAAVERRINELIAADLPVTYEFVTRDQIPEGVKLDKLPDNASETLRIVRIGDYDICACLGTHVKSTGEIGNFRITSTSFNDGSFRIVYKVAE